MQCKKICLTVETSTMKPPKIILRYLLVTFMRRLLVRVAPNIVLLLRTLSWSSLFRGLCLTEIFAHQGLTMLKLSRKADPY